MKKKQGIAKAPASIKYMGTKPPLPLMLKVLVSNDRKESVEIDASDASRLWALFETFRAAELHLRELLEVRHGITIMEETPPADEVRSADQNPANGGTSTTGPAAP